jgi:hypothetical protein
MNGFRKINFIVFHPHDHDNKIRIPFHQIIPQTLKHMENENFWNKIQLHSQVWLLSFYKHDKSLIRNENVQTVFLPLSTALVNDRNSPLEF